MAALSTRVSRLKFMTAQPGLATSSVMRADHATRGIHGRHVDGDVVARDAGHRRRSANVLDRRGIRRARRPRRKRKGRSRCTFMPSVDRRRCATSCADGAQADDAERLAEESRWPANGLLAPSRRPCRWSRNRRCSRHPGGAGRGCRGLPAAFRHRTSSFTAFALAPGVLNTTTPASAHLSSGMLFTPAPARATASRLCGKVHVVHGGAAHEHAGSLRRCSSVS